jgi:hypothetical protein
MTEKRAKPRNIFKFFDKVEILNQFVPWQHIRWLSFGNNVRKVYIFFSSDLREKSPPPIILFTRRESKSGKIVDA